MAEYKKPIFLQDESQPTQSHDVGAIDRDVIDARHIAVKDSPDNKLVRVDDGQGGYELAVTSLATGNVELNLRDTVPDTVTLPPVMAMDMMRTGKTTPLNSPGSWGETEVGGERYYLPMYKPSPVGARVQEWSDLSSQFQTLPWPTDTSFVAVRNQPRIRYLEQSTQIRLNGSDWVRVAVEFNPWKAPGRFPEGRPHQLPWEDGPYKDLSAFGGTPRIQSSRPMTALELLYYARLSGGAYPFIRIGRHNHAADGADEWYYVMPPTPKVSLAKGSTEQRVGMYGQDVGFEQNDWFLVIDQMPTADQSTGAYFSLPEQAKYAIIMVDSNA